MKNTINNKSGFTLLEIIIVIIIVGVLASLALPKFFQTVEFSKSTEALATIGTLRQSLERCYLQQQPNTYAGCTVTSLDVTNPSNNATPPNAAALFDYTFPVLGPAGYTIIATRRAGPGPGTITVSQAATGIVTRSGTNTYAGIR